MKTVLSLRPTCLKSSLLLLGCLSFTVILVFYWWAHLPPHVLRAPEAADVLKIEKELADTNTESPAEARSYLPLMSRTVAEALMTGDKSLYARCLYHQAYLLTTTGQWTESLPVFNKALAVAGTENHALAADCQYGIATVYRTLGMPAQAIARYLLARNEYANAPSPQNVALCNMNLGSLYGALGKHEQALYAYDAAMSVYEKFPRSDDLAFCSIEKAYIHIDLQQTQSALSLLKETVDHFRTPLNVNGLGRALMARGEALEKAGRYAEAQAVYHEARTYADRVPDDKHSVGVCDAGMGRSQFRRGNLEAARGHFRDARDRFEHTKDLRSIAICDIYMGHIARGQKHSDRALWFYTQALKRLEAMHEGLKDPEMAAMSWPEFNQLPTALASLYLLKNQFTQAFDVVVRTKALLLRNRIIAGSANPYTITPQERASEQELRKQYEQKERDLASQKAHDILLPASAMAARDYALTALNAFQFELRTRNLSQASPQPPTPAMLAASLPEKATLVEILLDEQAVYLFALSKREGRVSLDIEKVPQSLAALKDDVDRFREAIHDRNDRRIGFFSGRLSSVLLKPIQKRIAGADSLILCPDQFLCTLPFEALRDRSGKFLIEQYEITTAPSASVWEACHRVTLKSNAERSGIHPHAVVVTRSKFEGQWRLVYGGTSVGVRGGDLSPLDGVLQEREILKRAFKGAIRNLPENEATLDVLCHEAGEANVIHIATHAFYNPRSALMSGLYLAPNRTTGDNGILYGMDVYQWKLNAPMVVLSACETGYGMESAEGPLGIGWAFMAAGSPTVIASRWDANDPATALWMEEFYANYTRGASKSLSYRKACRKLISTGKQSPDNSKGFADPVYWACWVLMGCAE
ncbi:MAG: hypothetical protein JWL77_4052 [Chthonomonadaceae bacterium]|nr:hypothetical protein [Chthonomonadaceae bacterium]